MTQDSYQLTPHPVGSKREFWTLTWPLMVGLLSSTLMLSVDRLFLSHWNYLALNAAATVGMAYYMFLVIPMGVVEIAEVLVGRLHGQERHREIGNAAWQMVWVALALLPLFCLIAYFAPLLLFKGSGNELYEIGYFRALMPFGAIQCIAIALSGFFIGIGNVKIITISSVLANALNITLDYWFIFGGGPLPALSIPPLGEVGAALATGISQLVQAALLLIFFWGRRNREQYGTSTLTLQTSFLREGLRIGLPSGVGRSLEVIAHFLFFRFVMSVGPAQMTLCTIAQSIYILASFIIDAQSKGASAIVSNLLGARYHAPLPSVLRSGFVLHFGYFLVLFALVSLFPNRYSICLVLKRGSLSR